MNNEKKKNYQDLYLSCQLQQKNRKKKQDIL